MVSIVKPMAYSVTKYSTGKFKIIAGESGLKDLVNDLLSGAKFYGTPEDIEKKKNSAYKKMIEFTFSKAMLPKTGKYAKINISAHSFGWEIQLIIESFNGFPDPMHIYNTINAYIPKSSKIVNKRMHVCWVCGQEVKRLVKFGVCRECLGDGDVLWPGNAYVECITEEQATQMSPAMARNWQGIVGYKFEEATTLLSEKERKELTQFFGVVWNEWASKHGFPADAPNKHPRLFGGENPTCPNFEEDRALSVEEYLSTMIRDS